MVIQLLNSKSAFSIQTKKAIKLVVYNYYSLYLNSQRKPYNKIIFLLGHWRSGSSLLTHILSSNSQISGFGESKTVYNSEEDFNCLIKEIHWNLRKTKIACSEILLDSILMNHLLPNTTLLKSNNIYAIFLTREPSKSLPSIFNMGISKWGCNPSTYERKVLKYYDDRLSCLEKYAKIIDSKTRSFFLTYEQLVNQTELVLKKLQQFLELQSPLSEEYQLTPVSGKSGKGDWSDKIKSSSIIRDTRSSGLGVSLSPESLEKASKSFERSCSTLSQYCQTISE